MRTPNLPTQAYKDKKRLLRKLKEQQAEKKLQEKEKRYAENYKAVKFYEQQKAARRLKAARKIFSLSGTEKDGLAVEACEADVAYVKWFPRHLRYVSLYADEGKSADKALVARRLALKAWALANSQAKSFLLHPPSDPNLVSEEENSDEEENDSESSSGSDSIGDGGGGGGGGAKKKGRLEDEKKAVRDKRGSHPTISTTDKAQDEKTQRQPKKEELRQATKQPVEIEKTGSGGRKGKSSLESTQTQTVILPSRPQPPPSSKGPRGPGQAARDGNLDADDEKSGDELMEVGAEGLSGVDLSDSFFTLAPSSTAGIEFRELRDEEEEEEEGGGGEGAMGSWRGSSFRPVYGARTSSARYEREHMSAPRYRDSAAAPSSSKAENELDPLAHLSSRKRKRAERAKAFQADKGGGVQEEAFFGTSADPKARLKSADRVFRAEKREREGAHHRFQGGGRGAGASFPSQWAGGMAWPSQRTGEGRGGGGDSNARPKGMVGVDVLHGNKKKERPTDKRSHVVFD